MAVFQQGWLENYNKKGTALPARLSPDGLGKGLDPVRIRMLLVVRFDHLVVAGGADRRGIDFTDVAADLVALSFSRPLVRPTPCTIL